jgi:hypothetical protein
MNEAYWRRRIEKHQRDVRTAARWWGHGLLYLVAPGMAVLGWICAMSGDGIYLAILLPLACASAWYGSRMVRWGRLPPESFDDITARAMRRANEVRKWLGLKPFEKNDFSDGNPRKH